MRRAPGTLGARLSIFAGHEPTFSQKAKDMLPRVLLVLIFLDRVRFKGCAMDAMDQFVTRANIGHFRDRLSREVNPETTFLQRLLVEEEDKLGADLESLADAQRHIEDGHHRIERQRALVATIERYGLKGLDHAKCLLDGLAETQVLYQHYYDRLLIKISENQL
jgi:hypothetical protein